MFNLKLSIVIPVYNEEKNIEKLINKIFAILKKKINSFEIIIVDDNSKDCTSNIVKRQAKKNKMVKYILRKKKRDLSMSVIRGFEAAVNDIIIVMDGDLQHNPKYILKFLEIFSKKNSDFVIGCRNFKKYNFSKSLSFKRYLFSKFVILLNNFLLRLNLKDPMSGFFLFKKSLYLENKKNLYKKGFKILLDLIIAAKMKKQIMVDEFFINFDSRSSGKSKMNIKVGLIYLIFLLKKTVSV